MRRKFLSTLVAMAFVLGSILSAGAGWQDQLKGITDQLKEDEGGSGTGLSALSDSEITAGLREALSKAVDQAISNLGREGGYMQNMDVRIPLPERLQTAGELLRAAGQSETVDRFILSMNRAAERAVPETAEIFGNAIRNMTMEDARKILNGPDDAATRFFERTSRDALAERIQPIVSDATNQVGVTRYYKDLTSSAKALGPLMSLAGGDADLDRYVTGEALDGLFQVMADEEKRIRKNPAARTTSLLKKVFGTGD